MANRTRRYVSGTRMDANFYNFTTFYILSADA